MIQEDVRGRRVVGAEGAAQLQSIRERRLAEHGARTKLTEERQLVSQKSQHLHGQIQRMQTEIARLAQHTSEATMQHTSEISAHIAEQSSKLSQIRADRGKAQSEASEAAAAASTAAASAAALRKDSECKQHALNDRQLELHGMTERNQRDRNKTKKLQADLARAKDEKSKLQPLAEANERMQAAFADGLELLTVKSEMEHLTARLQGLRKEAELLQARDKAADQASSRLELLSAASARTAEELSAAVHQYRAKCDAASASTTELEARGAAAQQEVRPHSRPSSFSRPPCPLHHRSSSCSSAAARWSCSPRRRPAAPRSSAPRPRASARSSSGRRSSSARSRPPARPSWTPSTGRSPSVAKNSPSSGRAGLPARTASGFCSR